MEEVPVEELGGLGDGFGDEFVPLLFAVFFKAALPEEILVATAFAPGVVRKLEAGAEMPIGEERRAKASAEREAEFDALAVDGSVTLNGGVVCQADGLFPAILQVFFEWKIGPGGIEVEGGESCAVLDDSGKAYGDAIKGGHLFFERIEDREHSIGSRWGGGEFAESVGERLSGSVDGHHLEAGAADVNAEGNGPFGHLDGLAEE